MPQTTIFLTLEEALAIHYDQIERYGGIHGIRDLALLESALARPQATFAGEDLHPNLFLKAAVLMHGIISNHPFIDGNKRTGTVASARFLFINGYELGVGNKALVKMALKTESKKISLEDLATWLKGHSKKI